jgi:putative sporulation protein YtaF
VNAPHLLSTVALAVAANLDNLALGVAYGVRGRRVPPAANLLIAVISGAGTGLLMLGGSAVGRCLPPRAADALGGLVFVALGGYGLADAARRRRTGRVAETPFARLERPAAEAEVIRGREAALLGLALAFNNMAAGVGAGLSGLPAPLTSALVTGLSLAAITCGWQAGRRWLAPRSDRTALVVSAALMVALGVYECFV